MDPSGPTATECSTKQDKPDDERDKTDDCDDHGNHHGIWDVHLEGEEDVDRR